MSKRLRKICICICAVAFVLLFSGGAFTVPTAAAPPSNEIFLFNPYRNVDFSASGWGRYRADFHTHTTNSDGTYSPQELVRQASLVGIDIMAIADHDDWRFGRWDNLNEAHPDHTVLTYSQVVGNRDLGNNEPNNDSSRAQTWPWADFGVTDNHNLVPIQATELTRFHHVGNFFTNFSDVTNSRSATGVWEQIEQATEHGQGKERFEIFHPERQITAEFNRSIGRATDTPTTVQQRMDWLNNESENALHNAQWYQDLFHEFDNILSIEVYNSNDRHPSRDLYDRIMRGMMPNRPVWLSANSDDHGPNTPSRSSQPTFAGGTTLGWSANIMMMPNRTETAFRESWQQGAYFASSFGRNNPATIETQLGLEVGGRWDLVPTVKNIVVNEALGTISITADNYTDIVWLTEDSVDVEIGSVINYRNAPGIVNYVRAVLTNTVELPNGNVAIVTTLTQPFGVGAYCEDSWYFHFTGPPAPVTPPPPIDGTGCNRN